MDDQVVGICNVAGWKQKLLRVPTKSDVTSDVPSFLGPKDPRYAISNYSVPLHPLPVINYSNINTNIQQFGIP